MKLLFLVLGLLFCVFTPTFGQTPTPTPEEETETESRIQAAVDAFVQAHRHKIGIFRVRPSISFRAGVDGNAVFGDEEADFGRQEDDIFLSATPSLSAGIKFGSRAYFRILQQVPFVYFRENEERRGIFNDSHAEFVTGNSNLLSTLHGSYVRRNSTFNEELDEPVEYTRTDGGLQLEHSLGHRIEMRHGLRIDQTNFELPEDIVTSLTLNDRRTLSADTGMSFLLNRTVSLTADANVRRSEALEAGQTTDAWQVLGGVAFHRTRLTGRLGAGYGGTIAEDGRERSNFVADASVDALLGKSANIGGFVTRRYEFSVLDANATRLTTQGGIRFRTVLTDRLSMSGFYTIGENDYGNDIIAGTIVDQDTFHRGDIGIDIRLVRFLSVRPGVFYYRRETPIPELDKEAYGYFISLGVGYTIDF